MQRERIAYDFFSCSKWKEAIDERDRSLVELNMGSKRSAVTLISYIYKSVKKKEKENSLTRCFLRWYVV